MTNLSDFLKCKKVRCVKAYGDCIAVGKEYSVLNIRMEVEVRDDEGGRYYWESDYFEPVIDELSKSAENPLQDIELTPEFEAVEPVLADNCQVNIQDIDTDILDTNADIKDTPKFKVGDPVYWGLKSRIFKVYRLMSANVLQVELDDCVVDVHKDELCPATLENYEKLCSLFECIDFEQPHKPLTGSDLAKAMLDKGWKFVPCYVHDVSDDEAMNRKHYVSVKKETPKSGYNFSGTGANDWKYAVPIDPKTGEPLTESVLDE